MSNLIEDFEFILKKHSSKRHLAIYNANKQLHKHTYRPQDVISSVSQQLKAISVADTAKINKSVSEDIQKFKKSTFLSVNKLPVYEEAPKAPNTFDTQFVSNTQLINIIEDAELIDKHRGMTQEFETSFGHTDKLNGFGGNTAKPPDKDNTNKTYSEGETDHINDKTHTKYCKHQNNEDKVTDNCKNINHCSNYCIENYDSTHKTHAVAKLETNEDGIGKTDNATPENVDDIVINGSKYNIINDGIHKTCLGSVRFVKNKDNIKETAVDNYKEQNSRRNVTETDTIIIDEIIPKKEAIIEDTQINNYKNRNLNNNIATDSLIYTEPDNKSDSLKDKEMGQGIQELNDCIEIDVITENYTDIPPSPVLISKRVKNISQGPPPLVFDLDTFEKFENFALSMLEHNDFEKAKHMINSQILGKELYFKIDEDMEVESKEVLCPVLRMKTSLYNIQSNKNFDEETDKQDFLTESPTSYHFNKQFTCESPQISKSSHPVDLILCSTNENNNLDDKNNLKDPIFSLIENQSPILSQILPDNAKKKESSKHFNKHTHNIDENENSKDHKRRQPIDQSIISILNDEILFSSDEEVDMHKEQQYLPFTCALETSFYNQSDVLDRTMYVGFQTASNRSIQICKDSFDKARSLLGGVDDDETTVTELVKICDDSNKAIDNTEVKEVVNGKGNENLVQINDKDTEICFKSEDNDTVIYQHTGYKKVENIYTKEGTINRYVKEGSYNYGNNNLGGFKTASNKIISLSDKALARCRKVFQDIDLDEKYDSQIEMDAKGILIKSNIKVQDLNMEISAGDFKDTDIKANFEKVSMKDECLDDLIHNINDEVIIQEFENIEMSLEEDKETNQDGGFVGFKTASDKNIVISDAALAKTMNIFKDIDGGIDENNLKSDRNVYPNMEDFNQPSSSKETFSGLKRENNKEVDISNASSVKSKDIIKYFGLKEGHPDNSGLREALVSKTTFPGFKTGNNTEIKVSATSLAKVKAIFEDVDIPNIDPHANDDPLENREIEGWYKPSTSKVSFGGFKTANNRYIKISEEALSKTRDIFNDIDCMNMPRKPDKVIPPERMCADQAGTNKISCVGFKTANNKDIRISDAALVKTRRIFSDVDGIDNADVNIDLDRDCMDRPEDNNLSTRQMSTVNDNIIEENIFGKEKISSIIPNDNTFQGFKTANNKQVKISKEALIKTKNIFKNIDTGDNFNLEAEKLHINSKTIRTSSFGTATDKVADEPKDDKSEKGYISTFKGFQTASNKEVTISEESLAESRNIFKDIDAIENITNTVLREDLNDVEIANTNEIFQNKYNTEHNSEFKGFQIGNNKVIHISETAVIESRKLFKDSSSFKGFHTANEKKVSISEQALEKCKTVFQDIVNEDERDENENEHILKKIDFSFKSANNQTIKVSEDALAKSKKVFEDKDFIAKDAIKCDVKDIPIMDEVRKIIDTQVIDNFEETLYTEDFKASPIKSKRSGSPILSCPRAKKRKKFETPYSQKPVKNTIKRDNTVINTNIIKFDDNYKKNKLLTLKDLQQYANVKAKIDPYITEFTYDDLLQFEFNGKRNDLSYTKMTINLVKDLFLASVNSKLVPEGWVNNHIKLIIWKLISYEIRFPASNIVCSSSNVLNQLKYRYDRELFNAERPALRKILERDDLSTKTMVLCVVQIYENGVQVHRATNLTSNIELLLTDGWYCIKASTDRMLAKLVYEKMIIVGTKLVTNGAELMNCDQGIAPWEDISSVRLKLSGNSTRRARWDARLGYHGNAAILTRLSTVNIDGGRVSKLRVLVTRVYPSLYVEKFEDGSTVTRSERLEHLHQMKYETERQITMEKLYEEVEKEFSDQESQYSEGYSDSGGKRTCMDSGTQIAKIMRKSNDPAEFRAQLTSSQSILLAHHTEKRREKLLQDVQARIREKMEARGMCAARNVVPVKKIRVVGVEERGDAVVVTKGMMSIWKPNEAVLEIIKEGEWIDVINVVPTTVRYSEIQLSAGRQSLFSQSKYTEPDKFKPYTALLKRKCYNIKHLAHNPTTPTEYNEIDTVGLVFLIDPSIREFESTKQLFQNVYITDGDKNMICVNFWGGLTKFGFENVLDTGQIVVCGNLQKRAGNTRKNIPQYRVTEFSYFTKTPKNENARIILEELNKIFINLDRRKFCEDCIVLKNNYSTIKHFNNENISPYRPNNSDLNISKNKQFINSPLAVKDNLNLTGLDFESTFKHTDTQDLSKELLLRKKRANEKITKLKMYGEPPPLCPITILNKSKNAFNSYKSPLLSESERSNATRIPNPEFDSSTNVASVKNTPQKKVVINDSEHSPVLDRTYVKSVNPVKLNFENNDSTIDHFAEEFDGSPPLSLD